MPKRRWILPLVSALVFAADQGSKVVLRAALPEGAIWMPFPGAAWLSLRVGTNTGAAFGLFQGAGAVFVWVAMVALVGIAWLYVRQPRMAVPVAAGLGLIAGGAAGNLLDRLLLGGAIDFVHVGPLPAFNLADVCIVLGAVVLAVGQARRW
ncbi:MAG: signal peptidase II [Anaerolineae bacterium]|nr:signal peptidase II [Anaerolineae bacterium]